MKSPTEPWYAVSKVLPMKHLKLVTPASISEATARPVSPPTARTSAKSKLIKPGMVINSLIP